MKVKHLLLAMSLALVPFTAYSADYDLSIPGGGFYANNYSVLVGDTVKLYATVNNLGTVDVEATAVCKAGDSLVSAKPLSAKANGASEETWFTWTPISPGTFTLSLNVTLDGNISDPNNINNYAEIKIFVDTDTDGDGIGDQDDPDDDNDGVPDDDDDYPHDPSRSTDTDGDGIDDATDSDDDNDGLYDWEDEAQGTSPTDYDTDGDGVNDKNDAFPTDPNRSENKPKTPAKPTGQVLGLEDIVEDTSDSGIQNSDSDDEGRVLGVATDTDEIYDEHTTNTIALERKAVYTISNKKQQPEAYINSWLDWLKWPNWLWLVAITTGLGAFIFFLIWRKRKKEKEEEERKVKKT